YGPVVRTRPDELAFSNAQAPKDIYAHKATGQNGSLPGGAKELGKFKPFYKFSDSQPDSILTSSHAEHAKVRKLLLPAFSDKALREQESIVTTYVDLLFSKLRTHAEQSTLVNLRSWYNWTTFDILGDLTFGDSFHCLDTEEDNVIIRIISGSTNE